jgi:hypothetical protein
LTGGIASGGLSPNVQATETAGADQINKTSAGLGDRMNKFLAARGFGKSGAAGSSALQTEIGREGALGTNASAAAGTQIGENNTLLSDALGFAFANPGQTAAGSTSGATSGTTSGATSGSGFGISAGGSVSGAFK